jgi:Molybdopterin converting factor, large subunit
MIKIQKEDFNSEEETNKIKDLHAKCRCHNFILLDMLEIKITQKKLKSIKLEVYEEMAYSLFKKIIKKANLKGKLTRLFDYSSIGENLNV